MKTIVLPPQHVHTGSLILVNRAYGYTADTADALMPVQEGTDPVLLQRRAVVLLAGLMEKIHGWQGIVPVSGWRSMEEQQEIWNQSLIESGQEFTETYVALPGHSEHQTGLAIDLGEKLPVIDFIRPSFPYSGICQTFRRLAAEYGFVERYPAGKEEITGIGHEPWHFQYVGVPHASIMADRGFTLEEYTDFIRQYPYGRRPYLLRRGSQEIFISYLEAASCGCTELGIGGDLPYSVSGNNIDGFILTEWR